VAGAIAVGAGAMQTWVTADSAAVRVSFLQKALSAEVQWTDHVGGLHDGGGVILAGAGVALVMALALIGSRRNRGLLWRLVMLGIGVATGVVGVLIIAEPLQAYAQVLAAKGSADKADIVAAAQQVHLAGVSPAIGAWLLSVGGCVLAVAAIMPGRRALSMPYAARSAEPPKEGTQAVEGMIAVDRGAMPRKRKVLLGGGIAVLAVIVIAAVNHSGESTGNASIGSDSNEGSGISAAQRECVTTTRQSEDSLSAQAEIESSKDVKNAVINSDGDPAYVHFAAQLQDLPLDSCPTDFQTAYQSYAAAWQAFGSYYQEATKWRWHKGSQWSDSAVRQRESDLMATIQQTDNVVVQVASSDGVDLPARTWSMDAS
jgi:hypothetical protein